MARLRVGDRVKVEWNDALHSAVVKSVGSKRVHVRWFDRRWRSLHCSDRVNKRDVHPIASQPRRNRRQEEYESTDDEELEAASSDESDESVEEGESQEEESQEEEESPQQQRPRSVERTRERGTTTTRRDDDTLITFGAGPNGRRYKNRPATFRHVFDTDGGFVRYARDVAMGRKPAGAESIATARLYLDYCAAEDARGVCARAASG